MIIATEEEETQIKKRIN